MTYKEERRGKKSERGEGRSGKLEPSVSRARRKGEEKSKTIEGVKKKKRKKERK